MRKRAAWPLWAPIAGLPSMAKRRLDKLASAFGPARDSSLDRLPLVFALTWRGDGNVPEFSEAPRTFRFNRGFGTLTLDDLGNGSNVRRPRLRIDPSDSLLGLKLDPRT